MKGTTHEGDKQMIKTVLLLQTVESPEAEKLIIVMSKSVLSFFGLGRYV
jgi:hypothetical protein